MTFTIKHTRSPGARIAAEYLCPVHGRFAVDVPRDENGEPAPMCLEEIKHRASRRFR